jgi:hypothetical protein
MTTRLAVIVGAGAVLAAVVTAAPAYAAPTGDSTVTFTITGGSLDITVPATVALGSGAPGTDVINALGAITVVDGRALLTAAWTTSVASTDFTTGGGTPAETVADTAVRYWSGPATATAGIGTFTPSQATAANAVALSTGPNAMATTAGVGNNSVTWNPTLIVAVPAAAVGGVYTGTVTHSVA